MFTYLEVPLCWSSCVRAWFWTISCCCICMFWATAFCKKACWYAIVGSMLCDLCWPPAAWWSSEEGTDSDVIPPDGVEVPCGLFDGDREGISPAISKSPLEVERVGVFVREVAACIDYMIA